MKNDVYQLEIELALLRICEGIRDGVEGEEEKKKTTSNYCGFNTWKSK